MTYLHEPGYPVPRIDSVDGSQLVMEHLDGPTMLDDLARHPRRLASHAQLLADLHARLGQ